MTAKRVCFSASISLACDLVTYTAENPRRLETEFRAAVEDYLAICAEVGKAPQPK